MAYLLKTKEWFKRTLCHHKFDLKDLKQTNIPEPETPKTNNHNDWQQYYREYWDGDWVWKRVEWRCTKCGKVFFGHCGLDITGKWTNS